MTLLLHSSMCSDTGTEYGIGGRAWLLPSDRSVHGVTTEDAGSSLTGMGVARGAGMHCALERSAEGGREINYLFIYSILGGPSMVCRVTWSDVAQRLQTVGGHLKTH